MKKVLKNLLLSLVCIFTLFSITSCKKEMSLSDYVSEYRTCVYVAESGSLILKATSGEREYPYIADGKAEKTSPYFEVTLLGADEGKKITISFNVNSSAHGGLMNYDSVKRCYSYSEGISAGGEEIVFTIDDGENKTELTAKNKRSADCLTLNSLLDKVKSEKSELITSLTDKNIFNGEIYIRYLYDEGEYFYVGITDSNKKITALLFDAKSGKLLAERTLEG